MKRFFSLFLAFLFGVITLFPAAKAELADPGFILSDAELFAQNTMTAEEIQNFLNQHQGILKTYADIDTDGLLKSAADIIYAAAQRFQVNPQVLLVMLQKEQSLITDPQPYATQLAWATGYAVCDTCSTEHPKVIKYKGFAKQVNNTAEFMSYVTLNNDAFYFRSGGTYTIDGKSVFIKNRVTAALYNYTPHLHGNEIFDRLWRSWFGSQVSYPNGTLLQAYGEPGVWLIQNGQKHAFANLSSLTSRYSVSQIIQVSKSIVDNYPSGNIIYYPEYSLLRVPSGKIYLLVNNQLRWISNEETFRHLGYLEDEIINTDETKIQFFTEGRPITMETLEPTGALIQDPETFGIYYVQDGVKYPLIAPELLSLNYPHLRTRKGTAEELNRYVKGAPVLLKDGLLVKSPSSPDVYVIAAGKKHAIDSEYTFNSLGYHWDTIQQISDSLLALHPDGDTLSVLSPISDQEAQELVSE